MQKYYSNRLGAVSNKWGGIRKTTLLFGGNLFFHCKLLYNDNKLDINSTITLLYVA